MKPELDKEAPKNCVLLSPTLCPLRIKGKLEA